MAIFESICIPSSQVNPCNPLQSEGVWNSAPVGSPFLAIPDVVFGAELLGGRVPVGNSNQERSVVSAPGQDLASSTQDIEAVGVDDQGQSLMATGLPTNVWETIDNTCEPSTRWLYFSKWKIFESWCKACAGDPVSCPVG